MEVEETFTDNARATDGGEKADFITTTTAGLGVSGEGRRAELTFDYDISYDRYLDNSDLDGFRQRLLGAGNVELWADHFFVDGRAAISELSLRRTGLTAAAARTLPADQTRVVTYSLSPFFTHRYGSWAESELRYRFNETRFLAPDVGAAATPPANTRTQEVLTSLESGRRFTRLLWRLSGRSTTTDRANGGELRRMDVELSGEYLVNRHLSLLARGGFEDIEDPGLVSAASSGPTWRGGVRLRPGPRSELRLEYGRRFGGTVWSGDMSYRVGPETTLSASYEEDVQTETGALAAALGGLVRDATGVLIDPVTGLAVDPNDPRVDFADTTFKQKSFTLNLSGTRGRNSFNLSAFFNTRNFEASGTSEQIWGADASIDRRLRPKLDGGLQTSYSQTTESRTGAGGDWLLRGTAFLSYNFSQSLTGTVSYRYLQRKSDFASDLRENLVSVRLRKVF